MITHASRRAVPVALGAGGDWLGVVGRGAKKESVAGWQCSGRGNAQRARTLSTASVSSAQLHANASRRASIPAFPLLADEQQGAVGEIVKAGRSMAEHLLAGVRGGLGSAGKAWETWRFERAQQTRMVSMEAYLQHLSALSDGKLLSEEMRAEFGRCVGLSWVPEAPFAPWQLLFERLFPESLGYDVRVEILMVEIPQRSGRPAAMEGAYLFVRRATLEGDGPVLLLVGGLDYQGRDRLRGSLDKLTGRIEKEAADLMRNGQARQRMLWLAFCAQDFCWGHIQSAGARPLRAAAGLHVQKEAGQRALLQLAEEVHSLLISRA